jgi:hypothetical protein
VIVACDAVHSAVVLEEIMQLGLECSVIHNRAAIMILPTDVNKGTGLTEALTELAVSARDTVGVGDAENDHSLLAGCKLAVAVANAVDSLQDEADIVLDAPDGRGVPALLEDHAPGHRELPPSNRWHICLDASDPEGSSLPAARYNILISGGSTAGQVLCGRVAEKFSCSATRWSWSTRKETTWISPHCPTSSAVAENAACLNRPYRPRDLPLSVTARGGRGLHSAMRHSAPISPRLNDPPAVTGMERPSAPTCCTR